jgi:hypothetical protein
MPRRPVCAPGQGFLTGLQTALPGGVGHVLSLLLAPPGRVAPLSTRFVPPAEAGYSETTQLLVEALEDRIVPSAPGGPFGPVTEDPADASPDWPSSGHAWFNTGANTAEAAISLATATTSSAASRKPSRRADSMSAKVTP